MFHFAYGSNLSSKFLRQYCPSAKFVMRAFLPNFRVSFPFYSRKRKGGISSIILDPGNVVRGVIYDVPDEEIEKLDEVESVPQGHYKRETFLVLGDDGGLHKADLYRVVKPEGPFTPAASYLELMMEGAEEHGLEADYLESLRKLFKMVSSL